MNNQILSPLQKTCLRWISRGRTVGEIAVLEGKAVAEIERCLERALAQLNVRSIKEAVEKADRFGID